MVFAGAKTHAKIYFRLFFYPRAEARVYKALTPTEFFIVVFTEYNHTTFFFD